MNPPNSEVGAHKLRKRFNDEEAVAAPPHRSTPETNLVRPMTSVKEHLNSPGVSVFVGAHDALSSRIAEEAGADGIWISSFEVHAAARLPDADILGVQDYVNIIVSLVDRGSVPVLVDANAGGGNAINTIRLVREFEKSGARGMCIEDNVFPKRCTFYEGMQSQLESVATFCGKLDAALDKRLDPDFAIVARTEALSKRLGMDHALERCFAYAERGVDGILIHDNASDATAVLEFAGRWSKESSVPLVCVPTTYNQVTYDELSSAGFGMTIFANYGIRSVVKALTETYRTILARRCLSDGNHLVVPMDEIFRLIDVDEFRGNEDRYVR